MEFQIGPWTANTTTNEISTGQVTRRLEARAMDVLRALYDRNGDVVSKDELIGAVWKRHAVTDHAVTVVISDLRNALGDNSRNPEFIQTVPKRGYRLIAEAKPPANRKPEPAPKTLQPQRVLVILLLLAGVIAAVVFSLLENTGKSSVQNLVVIDADNATNEVRFDAIASSLTAITLDVVTSADDLFIIRWRDNTAIASAPGRWRLETRIIKTESGLACFLELSDRTTGQTIWTRSKAISEDRFATAQSELVAEALSVIGVEAQPRLAQSAAIAAGSLYWKARLFWDLRTPDTAKQAQALLLEAIAVDPNNARAHAALADLYAHKTGAFFRDAFARPADQAMAHLQTAYRLSPGLFEARLADAHIALFAQGDAAKAAGILSALVEEKPSHAIAWRSRAVALAATGAYDGAVAAINRAQALDPLNATTAWDKVWVLYVSGHSAEAIPAIKQAERLGGNGDLYRGLIYAAKGDHHEAIKSFARVTNRLAPQTLSAQPGYRDIYLALAHAPDTPQVAILRAAIARLAGDKAAVQKILNNAGPETQIWARLWLHHAPVFVSLAEPPETLAN